MRFFAIILSLVCLAVAASSQETQPTSQPANQPRDEAMELAATIGSKYPTELDRIMFEQAQAVLPMDQVVYYSQLYMANKTDEHGQPTDAKSQILRAASMHPATRHAILGGAYELYLRRPIKETSETLALLVKDAAVIKTAFEDWP